MAPLAQASNRVALVDGAGVDYSGVDAAEVEDSAGGGVDEGEGVAAEAGGEFAAAGVGLGGDLDDGFADGEAGAGGAGSRC